LYEALLAFKIENSLSKDQILEIYINQIYLGQRATGSARRANLLRQDASHAQLGEIAMLAGLPQGALLFHPVIIPNAPRNASCTCCGACTSSPCSTQSNTRRPKRLDQRQA